MILDKLPTNSMYPFFVMLALAGIGGAYYEIGAERKALQHEIASTTQSVSNYHAEFHKLVLQEVIGEPYEPGIKILNWSPQSLEDRRDVHEHLQLHIVILSALGSVPDPNDVLARRQWIGYRKLTDKEFDAMLADPSRTEIDRVRNQAWEIRKQHDPVVAKIFTLWANQDRFKFVVSQWRWIFWGSIAAFVISVVLWYRKSQRHQDRAIETESSERNTEKRTDKPHDKNERRTGAKAKPARRRTQKKRK